MLAYLLTFHEMKSRKCLELRVENSFSLRIVEMLAHLLTNLIYI